MMRARRYQRVLWLLALAWWAAGGALTLGPGRYRALTKIRLRKEPDVAAEPTGASLIAGEEFEALEALEPASPGSPGYLKLPGGWIFDQGVAGRWLGKPIIEAIELVEPAAAPAISLRRATQPPPPVSSKAAAPPKAASVAVEPPVPEAAPAVTEAAPAVTEATPAVGKAVPEAADPVASEAAASESTVVSPEIVEPQELVPPLATTKVETVRLPEEVLGAGFEVVRVTVEGAQQPLTFILGNGFPCNALTTRGKTLVGAEGGTFTGGWLSEAEKQNSVDLKKVKFLETGDEIGDIKGFSVMDFPQAMLAEQLGLEVHGMLGKPFFTDYDLDVDRYRARGQLFAAGAAASQGFYSGVKHLPGIELPGGNLGLAVKGRLLDEPEGDTAFIGLVDSSAAHTVLNWEAAKLLGFSKDDAQLATAAKVLAASAEGSAEEMPVTLVRLSLCSAPEGVKPMLLSVSKEEWESTGGKGWYFEDLSGGDVCVDFGAVNVAIGNPLSLAVMADSKIGPFTGAAAIIGQDLLFQADRVVMNQKDSQLWLQPGEMKDALEM